MADIKYEDFIRTRITELRLKKDVSEHKMSLDLDKSGAYIRGITSGANLPSLKELFNIIAYFNMTPAEFFSPTENINTPQQPIYEKLRNMTIEEMEKVATFIDWIHK